jgi:hypothetical protein
VTCGIANARACTPTTLAGREASIVSSGRRRGGSPAVPAPGWPRRWPGPSPRPGGRPRASRPDGRRGARRAPGGGMARGCLPTAGPWCRERAREHPPRRLPGDRPLAFHHLRGPSSRNRLHPSFLGSSTVSSLLWWGQPPARPNPWMHATGAKVWPVTSVTARVPGKLLGRTRAPIRSRSLLRFQDAMP